MIRTDKLDKYTISNDTEVITVSDTYEHHLITFMVCDESLYSILKVPGKFWYNDDLGVILGFGNKEIDKLDSDSVIDFKLLHNTGYYFQVYYLMCMFGYEYIDDVEQNEMNKLIPLKYEKYYFHNNKYRLLDLSTYHFIMINK